MKPHRLPLSLLALLTFSEVPAAMPPLPAIIPAPVELRALEGAPFVLTAATRVRPDAASAGEAKWLADWLGLKIERRWAYEGMPVRTYTRRMRRVSRPVTPSPRLTGGTRSAMSRSD